MSTFPRAALRTARQWMAIHNCRSTMLQQQRNLVTPTSVLLEKRVMKVPTMGDSITEGTIVEWTAAVGQGVKEGDVVALVETDKVTVDIKAEIDGVVVQQFGAVDDTVEVGADLYELDTEAEATVEASSEASAVQAAEPAAVSADAPAPKTEKAAAPVAALQKSSSHRTPSIKFLGKDGWARAKAGETTPTLVYIPPMYGRPAFTEEEMEALITGGANIAPAVKMHAGGAKFGY